MTTDASVFGYFFEAVHQAASRQDGFRLVTVRAVPWAWQLIDGSVSTFGWVVQLWDGQRLYLEYAVDEGRAEPEHVSVRALPPNEAMPEVGDPAVRWFAPHHVDALVRSMGHAMGQAGRA